MMIFININVIIKAMLQIIIYDKPNKAQDVIETSKVIVAPQFTTNIKYSGKLT